MILCCGRDRGKESQDNEEMSFVGEVEGRENSGDDTSCGGEDAVHEQLTKGDGRVDNGDGDICVVAESKSVPGP
jgi:hypothetical protein